MCASFVINDDDILEENEIFSVSLSTRDDGVTINPPLGTVTIIDDDSKNTQ